MKPKKDDQEPVLNVGDVSLAPRETVSATLRRHRKLLGQDLKTVAEALRIRYVYLEAIEQGRYDALPGPTYALGFIKTYAEYLDLDEEEIVQRFRDDVDGLDDQTQLVFPSPVPEGKVPGGAILFVALLMGSMAYGGWHYLSNRDSGFADFIPALPDRLQALFDGELTIGPDSERTAVAGTADAEPGAADAESGNNTASGEALSTDSMTAGNSDAAAMPVAESQSSETEVPKPQESEAQPSTAAAALPTVTQSASSSATGSGTTGSGTTGSGEAEPAVPSLSSRSGTEDAVTASPVSPQIAETSSQSGSGVPTSSQAGDATAGNRVGQGTVAVATLAAPLPQNQSGTSNDTAVSETSSGTGTTVISSQSVTNQAATNQAAANQAATNQTAASTEIPAAPAAPVTTQLVAIPDATQPQIYGEDNSDARIILRATQDAWVQVRDSTNELLLTRVLREGDTYRVPNQQGLTLLTGNAGGIDVLVDGTLLAPLGPVGSVRRDLALDPQVLLAGATPQ
ncbi:RodZ domain-containing protein [Pelagibius sp. Alg239-R121]|uniref:RodZ domain-containing protein n=1 Tax=Pelagibius sp. Alg239-R121 TaxID=2993448 RepID=UPI0024A6AD59|nr:RodZ domain-containing protein [Pelagibius sp. Alg239-R121]